MKDHILHADRQEGFVQWPKDRFCFQSCGLVGMSRWIPLYGR